MTSNIPPKKRSSAPGDANNIIHRLLELDSYLKPYAPVLIRLAQKIRETEHRLTGGKVSLTEFASGHEYFGLHFRNNQWIFREWAPNATAVYLVGDMTGWREDRAFALEKNHEDGTWCINLPPDRISHGDFYRLRIHWADASGDRIPVYARRVVQDPQTLIFNAQAWHPPDPYQWQTSGFRAPDDPPLIYEAHVGMAQEEGKIGTFKEFTEKILPKVVAAGYNMLQLMAIPEHPYYASFGYQVSNFFAASSRFGPPEDLKALVDAAHAAGLRVIMDLIHSHAVANEVEGLSRFDGTPYQYFHGGSRGRHPAWDSRLFDYGKIQVLHFLLSNCRFWLDEYRFDGYRFDGITSMLYHHHGLSSAFTTYDQYFDDSVDEDALTYLTLANRVVHGVRKNAVTIAEDVSGMPGLALSDREGGIGFDYRFAMGVPDYWIRIIKENRDEDWPMGHLWHELTNRRAEEKTISYAESHDQALVGDQTVIFRLIGADMYDRMQKSDQNFKVDRGIALHKLIRLITLATAGHGYLNFMGNEFGHPEWIDFPREGNGWSYHYARRQWHLAEDNTLRYEYLGVFDKDMIALARHHGIPGDQGPQLLYIHEDDKLIAFMRRHLLFVFNFHPEKSFTDYPIVAPSGKYRMIFNTDTAAYGGYERLAEGQTHFTLETIVNGDSGQYLQLYLPTRTALVLAPEG